MTDMTPPSPWSDLKFEPKSSHKIAISASSDADILKAVLESKDDSMPWEQITLPSQGHYYDKMIPGGVVEVRPMGIDTDKILATQRFAQSGKALDYLFKKCVRFPSKFDPLNLIAGDRTFLLYYLRGITHGNIYEYALECTNKDCGVTSTHSFDMNLLASKIQGPRMDLGEEPFKVELPYLTSVVGKSFWVKIRLMRGYDILRMTGQMGKKKRTFQSEDSDGVPVGIDETIAQNMYDIIVEVMGDKNPATIKKVVDRPLHSMDSATIREFVKEVSPGIDTKIEVTCPHCGSEMGVELPITESFFRPSKSNRSR